MVPSPEEQLLVQQAARALGRARLVHAYGHCSMRLDERHFLVCAPHPLETVGERPGTLCPTSGPLPDGVLGEVRVHQQIYARRSEVGGVCRIMPAAVMALSTLGIVPRPRHGIGAYFDRLPLWPDPMLLRDDAGAGRVAEMMGSSHAIILRGNGAIVAAETLPKAVTLCWFLEDAARMERDIRAMGADPESGLLDAQEIAGRQVWTGNVVERMWEWLTRQ